MSSLLGWLGPPPARAGVLQSMADACGLPQAPLQAYAAEDLTVAATSPVHGSDCHRLAVSADGQVIVAFAGHLYDEELARKQRPAAYCLELYQRHGPGFAIHLNGTLAIAVHDRQAGQLHLITDRMASRALYYLTAAPLVFGTEVKFILEYPGVSRQVNHDRLREFLVMEFLPGTATYYDHIRQVPSATVLTWAAGQVHATRYWTARFTWDQHGSIEDHARQIASVLRNSMRRVCAGHERIGLMLSAGLDSRAVACASEVPLACMTMHVTRGPEVTLASRIAATLGYPHHFIALSDNYPLELVTVGSLISDGMQTFHHAQGWLTGPQIAEQGLSLVFTGTALDSYFSGNGLPRAHPSAWGRMLPPALKPAETVDPMDYLLERFHSAPRRWLDQLLRGCSTADVEQGSRRTMLQGAAEITPGALSSHDVVNWLTPGNIARLRTFLNVTSFRRLTDEGGLCYDNEVREAFLALPPAYRFLHRAYGPALRLLNPAVAAIPREWTCLPIPRNRRDEIIQHYQAWAGVMADELRARMCGYRRHDRAAWPRLRVQFSHSRDWHRFLRQRLNESYLVDHGLVNGDALGRMVEWAIAGRRKVAHALGPWITLDEWLVRYG